MHRSLTALLALVACSLTLGVRADNPETALLVRYQRENADRTTRSNETTAAAVAQAKELQKADPLKAVQVLRAAHAKLDRQTSLTGPQRRRLVAALQQHIDDAVHVALLKLPRTTADVLAEYKDHDARPKNDYGVNRGKLIEEPGRLLFCNGVEYDAVVHGVSTDGVRCTLQGHRLRIPGWQLPVVRLEEGYFFFDYRLRAFTYASKTQLVEAAKLWQAPAYDPDHAQSVVSSMPYWDALARRLTRHGQELASLYHHGVSQEEIGGCLERHVPELARACRDPRLEHEIGAFMPDADRATRRAIRALVAGHADKSGAWQHSRQATLAAMTPFIRAASPHLTAEQEERVGAFILEKAEQEMQRRPL